MTADDLKAWMKRHNLSKSEVHRLTGIARTTLDRYLAGRSPIPKVVHLACAAIEESISVSGY